MHKPMCRETAILLFLFSSPVGGNKVGKIVAAAPRPCNHAAGVGYHHQHLPAHSTLAICRAAALGLELIATGENGVHPFLREDARFLVQSPAKVDRTKL